MSTVDLLHDAGFATVEARSAAETLVRIGPAGDGLAAAVIDLGLPDRQGYGVVSDVRTRCPVLPIVIASGQPDAELAHRFRGDARVTVLGKPYDGSALVDTLKRMIGG